MLKTAFNCSGGGGVQWRQQHSLTVMVMDYGKVHLTPAVAGDEGGCLHLMVVMDNSGHWCLTMAMDGSNRDRGDSGE
jgi:hypothetical protein